MNWLIWMVLNFNIYRASNKGINEIIVTINNNISLAIVSTLVVCVIVYMWCGMFRILEKLRPMHRYFRPLCHLSHFLFHKYWIPIWLQLQGIDIKLIGKYVQITAKIIFNGIQSCISNLQSSILFLFLWHVYGYGTLDMFKTGVMV